jgi:hypothetical protein
MPFFVSGYLSNHQINKIILITPKLNRVDIYNLIKIIYDINIL